MLHNLTIGHLDHNALDDRMAVVVKPLEVVLVHRLPAALGADGCTRLLDAGRLQGPTA